MLVFLNLKQLTQVASNNTWIAFIEKSAFWAGLAFVLILLVFLGMVLMLKRRNNFPVLWLTASCRKDPQTDQRHHQQVH